MTDAEIVQTFQDRLNADPDLFEIGAVIGAPLMLVEKSEVVATFDRLAAVWAESRGATFKVEVSA